eukprot:454937_1
MLPTAFNSVSIVIPIMRSLTPHPAFISTSLSSLTHISAEASYPFSAISSGILKRLTKISSGPTSAKKPSSVTLPTVASSTSFRNGRKHMAAYFTKTTTQPVSYAISPNIISLSCALYAVITNP